MGREAGSMGERLSAQVLPKGLDVLSSDLRRRRRAKGERSGERTSSVLPMSAKSLAKVVCASTLGVSAATKALDEGHRCQGKRTASGGTGQLLGKHPACMVVRCEKGAEEVGAPQSRT